MSLLVVGSIAFDSIETPHGAVEEALGGSATFFAVSASFFTTPRLVGVVGEDFPDRHKKLFVDRGIDTTGLTTAPGKTFRWKGRYHQDMNTRDTLEVHLNVFGDFEPRLPPAFRSSTHVFLANSSPVIQAKVLDQISGAPLVMADTMDLWIETQHDELLALLPRIDGLLLNDSEARLLTGEENMVRAGHAVRKLGPTGAGDCFAGGIMGYLDSDDSPPPGRLRRAMAFGTVISSLVVEGFGLKRLERTDRREIDDRLEQYRTMLSF
jgi:sugar/nucleoside kinase (ribokinase family)